MGKLMDWLVKPAPVPTEHSSLASLVVSSQAQALFGRNHRALAVAAIYRARQLNADTLGSLPVKAGDGLVPAPNKYQDTQEFVVETILSMQDNGEAYWRVTRGEMRVLDPSLMEVDWNKARTQRTYTYDGKRLRNWGIDPSLYVLPINRAVGDLKGQGPMQSGRIAGIIAEQAYVQSYYENSAQPTGLLSHPGVLTETEAKAFLDQWEKGQETRSTGVLSGGLEYRPMSFNPSDSEWTETHMLSIGDISTLFGVPGTLLNYAIPGSSITYQAIGDVYQGYFRSSLAPTYARRIEKAWSKVLGQAVRFDPEELFLASMKTRVEAAAVMTRSGYDAAESLDIVGLPPVKHNDWIPTTVYDPAEVAIDE